MRTVYVFLTNRLSEARRASVVSGVDGCRTQRKSNLLIASCITLLAFMLAACGTNTGAGTGSAPPPAPTIVQGYGTSNGCPSDIVVNTVPAAPNVTVKPIDHSSVIIADV